jgi:hypothetical protein
LVSFMLINKQKQVHLLWKKDKHLMISKSIY